MSSRNARWSGRGSLANSKMHAGLTGLIAILSAAVALGASSYSPPARPTQRPDDITIPIPSIFSGEPSACAALERNEARALSLGSGDFDEDGIPDLVVGYGIAEVGAVALFRGYPPGNDSPFAPVARVYGATAPPDLLVTGDFDADGHQDVLFGRRGAALLHLLPGDGRGRVGPSRRLLTSGPVEAIVAGDFDPRDGLEDLSVSVRGPTRDEALVYGSTAGAFFSRPRRGSSSEAGMPPGQAAGVPFLAMRLNGDALADFVVLAGGGTRADVSLSTPAATFVVTNTGDSGPGSLRQALLDANASPGADAIRFDIPGAGVQTITPLTPLPLVTGPVTIDATTQATFAGTPVIELSGSAASGTGLEIAAGSSVVRGFAINRFADGLLLTTNGGNIIEGNFIGTDPSGTIDLGQTVSGIRVAGGTGNVIGGTNEAARNLISGNDNWGVMIASSGNFIRGNFIGTDRSGTKSLPNGTGLMTETSANASNTIGGLIAGSRNVISGNRGVGVSLGGTVLGHLVQGNWIGTTATGAADLGNGGDGIAMRFGSCCNVIGGTTPGSANVISGNAGNGLRSDYHPNTVRGNLIGTTADGTGPLGNDGHGVFVNAMSDNVVGGTEPGAGNTIAFNGGDGVALGVAGMGNAVLSNSIHSNAGLGIDLGPPGVTSNDPGDADTGPNGLQNYPVLAAARDLGDRTVIEGLLDSSPATTFLLELFSDASCDTLGHGEGEALIGSSVQTTGADGKVAFTLSFPAAIPAGLQVAATATDPGSNTSEFSACEPIVCAASIPTVSAVLRVEVDRLTWSPVAGTGSFDLVRGDLRTLSVTGGDFTASALACLADDLPANEFQSTDRPPPGEGFWFLVRGVTCAGAGTYDSGDASQSGSRDAEIDASRYACP